LDLLKDIGGYVDARTFQFSATAILIFLLLLTRRLIKRGVERQANRQDFHESRRIYITKLLNILQIVLFTTLIGVVWEISLSGLSVYFASIFTIVGVGLFANWSILSNLTASIVLYFFFPYRIGAEVKIMDGDNSVEGEILDIALFYIRIKQKTTGKIISYPNNLIIQRALILMD